MFLDAREVPDGSEIEADLCLIGGGAAGITIAREFRGRNVRVALLESGDEEPDSATQALYAGAVTGLPYFPLDTARLRQFGGTTNHWGGLCRPFEAADLEARDWIPHSGWPITLADLQPYYQRAAALLQIARPDAWATDDWSSHDPRPPFPLDRSRVETQLVQV